MGVGVGLLLCVLLASGFVELGGAVGIASSSSTALPFLPLLSLETDSLFAAQVLSYNLLFENLSTKYSLNRLDRKRMRSDYFSLCGEGLFRWVGEGLEQLCHSLVFPIVLMKRDYVFEICF